MSICLKELPLTRLSSAMLACLAVQAAVLEAAATQKPGLVCMDTQGIHADMDIRTLVVSAFSLRSYFMQAAEYGRIHAEAAPEDVFRHVRLLGRRAEKTMFAATGGVNTHKGLIFSQGLICAATGRLAARDGGASAAAICAEASSLARGIIERDLVPLRRVAGNFEPAAQPWEEYLRAARRRMGRELSAGEALYLRHDVAGIRGEAERGFPHALLGLKNLWDESAHGTFNPALIHALLAVMAAMHDTNILWRGGPEKLRAVQAMARRVLELGGTRTPAGQAALAELQSYCLLHRLSPGGCADILCLALFFHLLSASHETLETHNPDNADVGL
ncbi:MAG: triphosphoribosyl-dephospho-CoA synthase [Deltaproteobacteria bacterium]|nr:triphosphoribosyl-dephospho-CoA synthase [Deltaproteobacteria bacterium]